MATIDQLVRAHQSALDALDREVVTQVRSLIRLTSKLGPTEQRQALMRMLPRVVDSFGHVAGEVAIQAYETIRAEAGVSTMVDLSVQGLASETQTAKSLDWATKPIRNDPQLVEQRLIGVSRRLVLQPARQTTLAGVRSDRARYARVSQPGACAFCLMLSSRGAVYASDTADFDSHDDCNCFPTPVFNDSQLPKHNRQLEAEWLEATKGESDQLNAWRRHINAKRSE